MVDRLPECSQDLMNESIKVDGHIWNEGPLPWPPFPKILGHQPLPPQETSPHHHEVV